jgi:hypothetical protein
MAQFVSRQHACPVTNFGAKQGRRLRFASGRDNYGERSEPKKLFWSRGIIRRNSKTNNAGIKIWIDPPFPGVGAYMGKMARVNLARDTLRALAYI